MACRLWIKLRFQVDLQNIFLVLYFSPLKDLGLSLSNPPCEKTATNKGGMWRGGGLPLSVWGSGKWRWAAREVTGK